MKQSLRKVFVLGDSMRTTNKYIRSLSSCVGNSWSFYFNCAAYTPRPCACDAVALLQKTNLVDW